MRKSMIIGTIVLAACSEQNPVPTAPKPLANTSLAYVTVSNDRPSVGDTVVLTVRASTGEGAEALGSFAARLMPGPGLQFVGESPVAEGARALRASGDTVFAAGASPSGYGDGRLFAIRARVIDPALLERVGLAFTEATSVQFGNQASALLIDSRVFRDR